jgi:hypothetical protein
LRRLHLPLAYRKWYDERVLLLLACVHPTEDDSRGVADDTAVDTHPVDTGNTGDTPVDDTAADDTAVDTRPSTFACPTGMVPVPSDSPSYCIDAYELAVDGDTFVSAPGETPVIGLSFDEVVAACAAMPAVDADGTVYAMRHLALNTEWEDAGDGVIGEGGTAFPWGDTFDDTRCVTLSDGGTEQFDGLQLTGSMPRCVSVFGLYDQIGNAWEWTDSQITLDIDAAVASFTPALLPLSVDDDGALVLLSGDASRLGIEAAGLQPPSVQAEPDGHLYVTAAQVQPSPESFFARGYLLHDGVTSNLVPVRLVRVDTTDPDTNWRVTLAEEYDGETIPDKRGCAWYTGGGSGCALATASLVHLPDFDGTIGFRCVAPPYATP